jgi:hypothetical protein
MWDLWGNKKNEAAPEAKPKNELVLKRPAGVATAEEAKYKIDVVWEYSSYHSKYRWHARVYHKEEVTNWGYGMTRDTKAMEWVSKDSFEGRNKSLVILEAENHLRKLKAEAAKLAYNRTQQEERYYK